MNILCRSLALLLLVTIHISAWSEEKCDEFTVGCTFDNLDIIDKELNRIYIKQMRFLTAKDQVKLKTEQRKWLKKRDSTCKKEVEEQGDDGSMAVASFNLCLELATKERVEKLRHWKK